MTIAYVASRTLREFRMAALHADATTLADVGYWTARVLKVVRRNLPGIRCESAHVCIARGGFDMETIKGADAGGGFSLCRLHAEYVAAEREHHGEHARVIEHVCDEACDHADESEWT